MTAEKTSPGAQQFRVTPTGVVAVPLLSAAADAFDIVCMTAGDDAAPAVAWVGPGAARVKLDAVGLWYAGSRAVVIAPPSQWTAVQNVLADVATIESVVRQMTAVLEPIESAATADVPLAYDINRAQRSQWDRLRRTMQTLAGLRLKFARLEPTVEARSPHGVVARRVRKLLLGALDLPHRVESLGNRMEACEDLYEGAVDRITDFRWWQKGNFLEIAIVALLGLETTLLVIDLILRMRSGR